MSYCRKCDDSDVYIIKNVYGYMECVSCDLISGKYGYKCATSKQMLSHVDDHFNNGDHVPKRAVDRLRKEASL